MASSWRWPCERLAPRSPRCSPRPARAAGATKRRRVGGFERARRCAGDRRAVAVEAQIRPRSCRRRGRSWKTMPTWRRRLARSHSRTSTPSTSTRPRVDVVGAVQQAREVVLPSPVGPTSATLLARRDAERAVAQHPLLVRRTRTTRCSKLDAPPRPDLARPRRGRRRRRRCAGRESSRPKMRSADAIAACITVYLAPRSRIGQEEAAGVLDERDQPAEGQGPGHDPAAPVPEQQRQRERAQRFHRRVERGLEGRRAELGRALVAG